MSRWVLNISKDRDSTSSWGNLFQCSTTMFNQNVQPQCSTISMLEISKITLKPWAAWSGIEASTALGKILGTDNLRVTSSPQSFMIFQMMSTDVSRLQLYEFKSPLDKTDSSWNKIRHFYCSEKPQHAESGDSSTLIPGSNRSRISSVSQISFQQLPHHHLDS